MTGHCSFSHLLASLLLIFLVVHVATLHGQTATLPVVTIRATDGLATESGDPGLFTLFRDGPTNQTLSILLGIGGSASNGVDYESISNVAVIPAGLRTATIPIKPIQDLLVEGSETVELKLLPPPTANAPSYLIGSSSNAVVTIFDDDGTNSPPVVRIVTPTNHSIFTMPVNIGICAEAHDLDGFVSTVEFFAGTNSIGVRTNNPYSAGAMNPFCLIWTPPAPGEYVLSAVATDDRGATASSDPITILVRPPGLPVVTIVATHPGTAEGSTNAGVFTVSRGDITNGDTVVSYQISGTASNGVDYATISNSVLIPSGAHAANILIKPVDDNLLEGTETVVLTLLQPACPAIFPPPANCYLAGWPSNAVVFIEDNDRITNAPPIVHITSPTNGTVFKAPAVIPINATASDVDDDVVRVDFYANDHFLGSDPGTNKPSYGVVWSNNFAGFFLLSARAFDSRGAVGLSEPVRITVMGTNEPPTNLPPVVTIFAVDPIAAEGTNWCNWYSNTPTALGGTNTATFLVRRTGATNDPLTVPYHIGGSASNGVDYVTLSGSVTIPAGEHSARIVVVPIDDTLPECTETVILSLIEPASAPAPYLVGWPPKAAAIIIDNDAKPPGTTTLCDGVFHLCYLVAAGVPYRLDCSLDMIHWVPIGTNTATDVGVHFADPESQDYPNRFYRVVPLQ